MSKQTLTKKRTQLVPQYMKNFSCIGSECEDSCCVGWHVTLDEETYKKYNRVSDLELAPVIDKKVTRIRSNGNSDNFAKIKMEKNGCCPFLSEEKLCNIQLKLGEDYLSHTCNTYPRIFNLVNGGIEKSATLSCPEVARLALLNPNPMEFDEIEDLVNIHQPVVKKINTNDNSHGEQLKNYFWDLRIFTIQVIQNRSYALWERLIILGMFYKTIEECIQDQKIGDILQHIANYSNVMEEGLLRDNLDTIPVQYEVQMKLAKELIDERFTQGIRSQRFMDCYVEMMQGLHYFTGGKIEDVMEHYTSSYKEYYEPFMNEHEYILENYLVNYVYKNLFPFDGYQSVFDAYVMMIVHYAMIKLHLIGMAGFHKGLDTDLVIKLIQSFGKTIEHNNSFLNSICHLLKAKEFTTLPYMAILIKN